MQGGHGDIGAMAVCVCVHCTHKDEQLSIGSSYGVRFGWGLFDWLPFHGSALIDHQGVFIAHLENRADIHFLTLQGQRQLAAAANILILAFCFIYFFIFISSDLSKGKNLKDWSPSPKNNLIENIFIMRPFFPSTKQRMKQARIFFSKRKQKIRVRSSIDWHR
jgi:hypothetical protein